MKTKLLKKLRVACACRYMLNYDGKGWYLRDHYSQWCSKHYKTSKEASKLLLTRWHIEANNYLNNHRRKRIKDYNYVW